MATHTNDHITENKPFSDSIKRIGAQARNWENIADYGTDLDLLQVNPRRRIVFSPKMLMVVVTVIGGCFLLQTIFIYSELRAQRATLDQIQSTLKALSQARGKSKP